MASDASDGALTRELASLARLELDGDRLHSMDAQLDTILGYIRRLQDVDVGDAVEHGLVDDPRSGLRDDEPGDGPVAAFDGEAALAGAPQLRERSIAVAKFKD